MNGGYEDGYNDCACFWGKSPGSLVGDLTKLVNSYDGKKVLDIGCGEGKNAAYFSRNGGVVRAVDISAKAIDNAKCAWPNLSSIKWEIADANEITLDTNCYDIVVCYGLLHCLASVKEVNKCINRLQLATKHGGYHLICAFNDRRQELDAHPNFHPVLLPHHKYLENYENWDIIISTDRNLTETHPHNNIPHTHSMTRILAKKQ